jgi:hypothetical protein
MKYTAPKCHIARSCAGRGLCELPQPRQGECLKVMNDTTASRHTACGEDDHGTGSLVRIELDPAIDRHYPKLLQARVGVALRVKRQGRLVLGDAVAFPKAVKRGSLVVAFQDVARLCVMWTYSSIAPEAAA